MLSPRMFLSLSATLIAAATLGGAARGQNYPNSRSGGLFGESTAAAGEWRAARPAATGREASEAAPPAARPVRDGAVRDAAVRPAGYRTVRSRLATTSRRPTTYFGDRSPDGVVVNAAEAEYLVDGEFVGEGEVIADEGEMFYGDESEMFAYGRPWHWMDNMWLFGGVVGFKGPIDQGRNGNFGFQEGINYAMPLSYHRSITAQVGVRFTQSNFSGSEMDDETRHQSFFTAGVFRRVQHGWQLGAAFDWLKDDFYSEADVHQVRAELSWVSSCGNELGFMAAISTADDQPEENMAAPEEFFEVNDQFAMFLRFPFDNGGGGRIFAGATSDRDGILGADLTVPINARWSLQTAATYLIPQESSGAAEAVPGHVGETWGLSIALVWYPGHCPVEGYNPFRPLFNVADNTSLLVDRRAD